MREETIEELNKVFEYIRDPKSYMRPIILSNKNGDKSIGFECWYDYEPDVWTLEDAFMFVIDTKDTIVPSKYAQYRAADLLEEYARREYYKAVDLKDVFVTAWLESIGN